MNQGQGSEDPRQNCMMIGRDRLYYSGLLGNSMKRRELGSVAVYVAPAGDLDIALGDGPMRRRDIAVVAPFTPHRLRTASGRISTVLIEPESITLPEIRALAAVADLPSGTDIAARIRMAAEDVTRMANAGGFSAAEFDRLFFGRSLHDRVIEPRIAEVLALLHDDPEETVSADLCSASINLSTSRFLHLFKESTQVSFRSYRMWRRARRFLDHANSDNSLTDVALDLGYPDSSHFSHSIRRVFGLKPRSIRAGSRQLRVFLGEDYRLQTPALLN